MMPQQALSQGEALLPQSPLDRKLNITCNNVQYQFGARGSSLPGFEVTCGQNNEAMLQIGKNSYKMQDVSMDGGFVIIFAGPIRQVCYDRNGKSTQTNGTGDISLEGTPFSFSKQNKLVATGCNYKLVANFSGSVLGDNPRQTSCSSWCHGNSNIADCINSVACCEAHMPMDNAQDFTLTFDKTSGQVIGEENGTCNAAFFLDQDDTHFNGGTVGGQRPLKDLLLPAVDRRMILDWAIGSGTCNQASTYNSAPLYCNNMSGCIDAPRGTGHLCKCNAGYDGNPYTADGCAGKFFFTHHRDLSLFFAKNRDIYS
jgi:hypothetical protein